MYCIYRCFNTQNYIYPFQNLGLGLILKIFLKFRKFHPRYSNKIYSYKKKECIRISFVYTGNSSSTASERRFRPSPCQGAVRRRRRIRSKFYFLKNLLCAFNSLQPMKNSYFPLRYKLSRVVLGAQEALLRNSWFATT